ncbi:YheC/YheD family protein [Bacillus sp. JJ1532]|uniref:YheC/YheD family protein n=1 Tax=unclassified Bacillus (in: firmicutes) TaxID=185979 RepID=UPI002FFFD726
MEKNSIMDKWYKHQILLECKELVKFLPETHLYTKDRFWEMMSRYKEIMIKPTRGNGGRGIIKVSKITDEIYEVHLRKRQTTIMEEKSLEQFLQERLGGREFLVQICISLAKVKGNPIDFRYIVQRKREELDWVITGKHGKVAQDGYIITNLQNGATVVTVEEALLNSNITNLDLEKTLAALDDLSLAVAKCYTNEFDTHKIWGFDLAVDESGHVWLIEANSIPLVGGFRYLEDLSMYNKILWYKAYNQKTGKKP